MTQTPMQIGIIFDTQHAALAAGMRALLPNATVFSHDALDIARNPGAQPEILAALKQCDHVITMDLPPGFHHLSSFALRSTLPSVHLLPPLHFAGYHPDVITLTMDGKTVPGPTGLLQSRVALLAYLTGQNLEEAAGFYNRLVFARLGYLTAFARERDALLRRFRAYRINLAPIFTDWASRGCFMHAPHAPRFSVMVDLARLACRMIGQQPDETNLATLLATTPDPLARQPSHPLFAAIAAPLGLPPQGDFCPPQPPEVATGAPRHAFRPETFLSGSYDAFRRLPYAALLATPGIRADLAALGLAVIDPARTAALAADAMAAPDAQAFLTWQGTVLQVDAGSQIVLQRPLRPANHDATDLLAPHALVLDATPRKLALLGGLDVAAGPHPNSATLSRGGMFLAAPPGRLAIGFSSQRAGNQESFLPLSRPALEALRTLLRGGWLLPGKVKVPRAAIRLAPGLLLHIGQHSFSLWQHLPTLTTAPGTQPVIQIGEGDTALTLTADPADPDADICLDPPPAALLAPTVGTAEAFRASPQVRLRLPPMRENRYPPFTISNAHAAWLYEKAASKLPRLGQRETSAGLYRASDKTVLLARGLEGVIADADGVWKDQPTLSAATGAESGRAAALLRAGGGPVIDQPLCVFYNPNLQNYQHWLLGALLPLHILTAHLPEGAALLLPPALAEGGALNPRATGLDYHASLAAFGLNALPALQASTDTTQARDVLWLEDTSLGELPAALLRSFRETAIARHPPLPGANGKDFSRILIKRRSHRRIANAAMVEKRLLSTGFQPIYPEDLTQDQQIRLFAGAQTIVAAHGAALANLIFCAPGTSVLELSPACAFRPDYWLLADKMELAYAVLPCASADDSFDGDLTVDMPGLRAALRLLAALRRAPGSKDVLF